MIIDLTAREVVEWLTLEGYVKELFTVVLMPGIQMPKFDWADGGGFSVAGDIRSEDRGFGLLAGPPRRAGAPALHCAALGIEPRLTMWVSRPLQSCCINATTIA